MGKRARNKRRKRAKRKKARKNVPPRKPLPRPASKKSRAAKVLLPASLAVAIALGSGHFAMKRRLGESYAKRIPVVRQAVVGGRQVTFCFGKHQRGSDLGVVERELERAKKAGKPYTVIFLEGANCSVKDRQRYDRTMNNLVKNLRKVRVFLKDSNKTIRDTAKREYARILRVAEQNLGSFAAKQVELAAKHNLIMKSAEAYTEAELRAFEKANMVHEKAAKMGQFEEEIKIRALYMRARNRGMSKTIQLALREAKAELGGVKPVRAIFYAGGLHGGPEGRGGAFRMFDRASMSEAHSILGSFEDPNIKITPAQRESAHIIMGEMMRLAELPQEEIANYKIPPKIEKRLWELVGK